MLDPTPLADTLAAGMREQRMKYYITIIKHDPDSYDVTHGDEIGRGLSMEEALWAVACCMTREPNEHSIKSCGRPVPYLIPSKREGEPPCMDPKNCDGVSCKRDPACNE